MFINATKLPWKFCKNIFVVWANHKIKNHYSFVRTVSQHS